MGVSVEFLGGPLDGRTQHVKSSFERALEKALRGEGLHPPRELEEIDVERIEISFQDGWAYFRTDLTNTENGCVVFRWRKA